MKNQNKIYVGIFVAGMVILSLTVALIMTSHYKEDSSKVRYELTRDYKKYKDLKFQYDAEKGKVLFEGMCVNCHFTGSIKAPAFDTNSIAQDDDKLLEVTIRGMQGRIQRGQNQFNGKMSSYRTVSHEDLAHVLGYIQQSFYRKTPNITPVNVIDKKIEVLLKDGPFQEKK